MDDRELLELAAKAAGLEVMGEDHHVGIYDLRLRGGAYWNPLTDDGDALRLAVKLKLHVQVNEASAIVETWQSDIGETKEVTEYFDPLDDHCAATRRAIVRAAAAIGKDMQ